MAGKKLWHWAQAELSIEGQEYLISLIIEPYGELVDDLVVDMKAVEDSAHPIDGDQSIAELKAMIESNYAWALAIDFGQKNNKARFWYISQEKLEPRLGERFEEQGVEYEQPLAVGWDVNKVYDELANWQMQSSVADLCLAKPEYRHIVRRIQVQNQHDYAEIQDNIISADFLPIDMLRCKLSFFGATHFDPRSDRWVRICMYKNAPFPCELFAMPEDDWIYPSLAENA